LGSTVNLAAEKKCPVEVPIKYCNYSFKQAFPHIILISGLIDVIEREDFEEVVRDFQLASNQIFSFLPTDMKPSKVVVDMEMFDMYLNLSKEIILDLDYPPFMESKPHIHGFAHEYGHHTFWESLAKFEIYRTLHEHFNNDLDKIINFICPVYELFADLLGIIYSGNSDSQLDEMNKVPGREFTVKYQADTWTQTTCYHQLGPTRYFIWGKLGDDITNKRNQSKIIQTMFESSVEMIKKMYNNLKPLSPSQLNQNFIQIIESKLKTPTLPAP